MATEISKAIPVFSINDWIADKPYHFWLSRFWQLYSANNKERWAEPVFCVPGKIIEDPKEKKRKERYYRIPFDRPILFSILSWTAVDSKDNRTDEDMIAEAKGIADGFDTSKFRFSIDNDKIDIRGQTDISKLAQRCISDFFIMKDGHRRIIDGYWLFLRRDFFDRGDYTIRSFGVCSSGVNVMELDYHIFIR